MDLSLKDDIQLVVERVFIGNGDAGTNKLRLQRLGVTHIVMTAYGMKASFPDHFHYHKVELLDEITTNVRDHLPKTLAFLMDGYNSGSSVLIHDQDGGSCTAAIILPFLVYALQMPLPSAQALIRLKKANCLPNSGFLR